jgi:kelch-like protein 24/35
MVSTLEVYDPETDIWQKLTPMSVPRVGPAVAAFDGKIYVFGGFNRDT